MYKRTEEYTEKDLWQINYTKLDRDGWKRMYFKEYDDYTRLLVAFVFSLPFAIFGLVRSLIWLYTHFSFHYVA